MMMMMMIGDMQVTDSDLPNKYSIFFLKKAKGNHLLDLIKCVGFEMREFLLDSLIEKKSNAVFISLTRSRLFWFFLQFLVDAQERAGKTKDLYQRFFIKWADLFDEEELIEEYH